MTEQQAATSAIRDHLGEAARNTGHAAREAARRATAHAQTVHGNVREGLSQASSAISNKGLVTATREGAQAFWKSRPLATIGLAVGGTIVAAHVVSHAFSGPRQQKAAARDLSQGGRSV